MVSLTSEIAGDTLVAMAISYVVVLVYSIYMAYLGWKQAKVYKQMNLVIGLLQDIADSVRKKR